MSTDPDRLVTVCTEPTEFAANVKIAVLADAGIEAKVFGSLGTTIGAGGALGPKVLHVDVQVRASDADAARTVLAANIADSVDIDWDEVDVGDRVGVGLDVQAERDLVVLEAVDLEGGVGDAQPEQVGLAAELEAVGDHGRDERDEALEELLGGLVVQVEERLVDHVHARRRVEAQ